MRSLHSEINPQLARESLVQIKSKWNIQRCAGIGISDSATPRALDRRAVESWEAAALDDGDIRGAAAGVHRDAQNDRSLLTGLAGFDRVNEGGSFGEGCLRGIHIRRTASDRAGRLGAGVGFSNRRGGGFLGFWSRRFWLGTLRRGSWLGFRQNLGLLL